MTLGDLSVHSLEALKSILLRELRSAVQDHRLTLQSKTLHLLHSAIGTSDSSGVLVQRGHRKSASLRSIASTISTADPPVLVNEFDQSLVNLVIDGLSSTGSRSVLQHWVDFVIMIAQKFKGQKGALNSLIRCASQQLRTLVMQLQEVYTESSSDDMATPLTDAEPIMMLSVLERLVTLVSSTSGSRPSEEGTPRMNEGGSGILGLMSGVFVTDSPAVTEGVSGGLYISADSEAQARFGLPG